MSVYFIEAGWGGAIKIGTSADVPRRVRSMQTANAATLLPLLIVQGSADRESELHVQFAPFRIGSSEWFKPSRDLMIFIVRELHEQVTGHRPAAPVVESTNEREHVEMMRWFIDLLHAWASGDARRVHRSALAGAAALGRPMLGDVLSPGGAS